MSKRKSRRCHPQAVVEATASVHEAAYRVEPLERRVLLSGLTIAPTEGAAFSGTVATFSDPDTTETTSDFAATINWGDGSAASAGTISYAAGVYAVSGTYTYSEFGNYATTVQLTNTGNNSATLSTLAALNAAVGIEPYAGLVFDSVGNLYGTTYTGGTSARGTVFEMAAGTHALSALVNFNSANGAWPDAGLIVDSTGNLYGTTHSGGTGGDGTVFEVAAGTRALSTLVNFNDTNGSVPIAGLVFDSAGNLYGTTYSGGTGGDGTVFEVAAGTHALSTLVNFNNAGGYRPAAGLIFDSTGNLYGTTYSGGTGGGGTVFEVAAGSDAPTTLASFNGTNGMELGAALILDSAGNLYGTTEYGGSANDGTVFEVAGGTHALTTLVNFNVVNGADPLAGLILDSAGNLYGTTYGGGSSDDGTVFELSGGTHALTTLVNFNGTTGGGPRASLIFDSAGNLYGTNSAGGGSGEGGTVFELAGSNFVTSLRGTATVADAPLSAATPVPVSAVEASAFTAPVATFTDGNPGDHSSDFTAAITWGGGSPVSNGAISYSGGVYTVTGTHTYAEAGAYTIGLLVTDAGGQTTGFNTAGSITAPTATAAVIAPFTALNGGVLTICGTTASDAISVTSDGTNIAAALNGAADVPCALSQVTAVDIQGDSGNDIVTLGAGLPPTTVSGEQGVDTVVVAAGDTVYYTNISAGNSSAGLTVQGPGTVTLGSANTYGGTTEIDSGTLLITGAGGIPAGGAVINNGSVIVDANDVVGQITGTGALTIGPSALLQLAQGAPSTTSTLGSLTMNSGGSLDISNNTLAMNDSDVSLSQVTTWVQNAGCDPCIMSCFVTGPNSQASRAVGYGDSDEDPLSVPAGDVEVKYVPFGDTNLDGTVDITDLTRAINNLGLSPGYYGGDVANQGLVNITDIADIINDLGAQLNASGDSAGVAAAMAPVKSAGRAIAPPAVGTAVGLPFSDAPIQANWLTDGGSILSE